MSILSRLLLRSLLGLLSCLSIAAAAPVDFAELDVNGDGVLSGSEAKSVSANDKDGNTEITRAEFLEGQEAASQPEAEPDRAAAEIQFRALDGNKDDRLSGTEMKGIDEMDSNKDQRITLKEYLEATVKGELAETSEYGVAVPADAKPFVVHKGELVRLVARGIAGSEITAKVTGPAKIVRTGYRRQVISGETPVGGVEKEFEMQTTGKGQVTVTITVEFPTGSKPLSTTYRFSLRDKNAVSQPE